MSAALKLVQEIGLQAGLIFLFLGSLFSLSVGISLLGGGRWVGALNERSKRWISTRQAFRPLDLPHNIEPSLYRWHLLVGVLMAVGAAFILYVALFALDLKAVARVLAGGPSVLADMAIEMFWWLGVVSAAAGLVVGILMAARPQWLRSAAWANHIYSARRATKPLESMNLAPDGWVNSAPKLYGGIIALCSAYVATVLGYFLRFAF